MTTLSVDSVGLTSSLLVRVGSQSCRQASTGNARAHAVGDEIRRDGADGVLGSGSGAEETRGGGLRSVDGRRREVVNSGMGDGAVAGADLGREDLLEASVEGDLFDTLEVLWSSC